ncbi:hypothetical protein D5F01_LYC07481 [Larimichthys crocea]|uniref:Uncharacterized protein n=1 Tax=Larimichthys crocea TaxID=215358 RepID=A0A6G0IT64_LARCR|nr:hypothetical protein D5F01_LYC07481 [Larimichthys crocea]
MDVPINRQMYNNTCAYRNALDRIVNKYSRLDDGGIEVDLVTDDMMVEHYMDVSRTNLNELESESLPDYSLRAQDNTRDPRLDFSHQDSGSNESCISSVASTVMSVEDDGASRSDVTQLTVSSLDESQRNLSMMALQPEDEDEELEMTLRNHGSSLMDLYPSLISRIGRAQHLQHVSNAADSVLRRYRRLRQQPNRSYVNNTFIVPQRQSNTKKRSSKSNSPMNIPFMGIDATSWSPKRGINNQQDWQSAGRVRREQHQPVLVMDLSGCPDTSKPKEQPNRSYVNNTFIVPRRKSKTKKRSSESNSPMKIPFMGTDATSWSPKQGHEQSAGLAICWEAISLNETFDVSELVEQPSTYAASPSRAFYPTAKAPMDQSLRSKKRSLAARSPQTDRYSVYESLTTAVKERPDIYSSPVRQSPLKARLMTSLSRSPGAFSQSPKAHAVESLSREPMRPRSMSTSDSFSPQRPTVLVRMLHPQDSRHSPQTAIAPAGHHGLRRHLSFDSSLSSRRVDEDIVKLYHRLVCQNKSSSFRGQPCRICARSSEASRGHSSSSLAALALSPHRSLLSKRNRELGWDSHHQSKRFRDEYCASSPGSKRHGNEMLRRRLSTSEYDGLRYSPSKHSMLHRVAGQQLSADPHQETWMDLGCDISGAEFSDLGGAFKSKMTNGYSPRKCW